MPSESCLTCSQRQILCDGTKPCCRRCLDARRKCRGYDRGLKVVFYDVGNRKGKKTTRSQKHPNRVQPPENSFGDAKFNSVCQSRRSLVSQEGAKNAEAHRKGPWNNDPFADRPLTTAKETDLRPVCLFISAFVPDSKNGTMLEFVPDLYKISTPSSCFRKSLQAVSLLNFMNRYKAYHLMQDDVRDAYYNAITSTNSALSNKALTLQDETLASVWLLSLYELLASGVHTFGEETPWMNHVQGTLALLRLRGRARAATKIGRQLFTLVYIPIVVMLMMSGQPPPTDIAHDYQEILQAEEPHPSALFDMISYIHKIADWRACTRKACVHFATSNFINDASEIVALLAEGTQLSNLNRSDERNCCSDSSTESDFASITDMSYKITIWTSNLLAIQTQLQVLLLCQRSQITADGTKSVHVEEGLLGSLIQDIDRFQGRLDELADRILNSVQYAFGDHIRGIQSGLVQRYSTNIYEDIAVGAYHIFWPLGALVVSPFVMEQHKASARTGLKVLGERFGIVQALRYV